jgi:predicted TIM-barrel fold metal-dependent hydrolase
MNSEPAVVIGQRVSVTQMSPMKIDAWSHLLSPSYARHPGLVDLVRRNNEDMAEIATRHPERFAGFAAATRLSDPEAAVEEATRGLPSSRAMPGGSCAWGRTERFAPGSGAGGQSEWR